MIKPKNVIIVAISGLILSLLISVIATHNLIASLIKGLIFAVIFGLLEIAIEFVYNRFLNDSLEDNVADKKQPNSKVGSIVDISIGDEKLTDDKDGPNFFVANNMQKLSSEDTENIEMEDLPESENVNDLETSTNISEDSFSKDNVNIIKEESSHKDNASSDEIKIDQTRDLNPLEDLPDIGEFSENEKNSENESIIQDSDFAEEGQKKSTIHAEFTDGSKASNHDSETMAKAIRTLLSKD